MAEVLERETLRVRPTGAALAADIEGVDLAQLLPPAMVEAIRQAWAENLVLRFRGQSLDDERLMRFSALFGELDLAPVIAAARVKIAGEDRYVDSAAEGHRYVSVISNIIDNGVAIGALGAYEAIWHTDMSYNPEPPIGSALYALEVPPSGRHRFCQHVHGVRHFA
jgi:alpha-ketoglutarate-dependent taurine dioxygenase